MLVRTSSAWLGVFFFSVVCHGADRSQFRGPDGNGVYPQGVPTEWDGSGDVSWSVEIPGGGWSSPVAARGVVFVTTAVADGESRPKGFGEGVQSMGSFFDPGRLTSRTDLKSTVFHSRTAYSVEKGSGVEKASL